ncbi:MAG: ferredoxin:thioredoxin reductase [Candidatus Heimdallarchaeota archaeon]|nr:ferredoxin:thioredoxin reductase [Candidatus Heimdallarchaeota archaeon]
MSDNKKALNDVKSYVEKIAERNNWILNPDKETLQNLIEGLMVNINRYGYYNCPCRDSQEDRNLDKDIICPCRYSEPDIREFGHCYCALYFDEDYDFSKSVEMIPERRE